MYWKGTGNIEVCCTEYIRCYSLITIWISSSPLMNLQPKSSCTGIIQLFRVAWESTSCYFLLFWNCKSRKSSRGRKIQESWLTSVIKCHNSIKKAIAICCLGVAESTSVKKQPFPPIYPCEVFQTSDECYFAFQDSLRVWRYPVLPQLQRLPGSSYCGGSEGKGIKAPGWEPCCQ